MGRETFSWTCRWSRYRTEGLLSCCIISLSSLGISQANKTYCRPDGRLAWYSPGGGSFLAGKLKPVTITTLNEDLFDCFGLLKAPVLDMRETSVSMECASELPPFQNPQTKSTNTFIQYTVRLTYLGSLPMTEDRGIIERSNDSLHHAACPACP